MLTTSNEQSNIQEILQKFQQDIIEWRARADEDRREQIAESPLFKVAVDEEKIALLNAHKTILNPGWISNEELNQTVLSGENIGTSAFYWLTATTEGKVLLQAHPQLLDLVNDQSLNMGLATSVDSFIKLSKTAGR